MERKVAIVTGGTKGIGKSLVRMMVEQDIFVCAIYHSDQVAAEKFLAEMREYDISSVEVYQADVANAKEICKVFREIYDKHGKIDYLINDAGITRDRAFFSMKEEEWLSVIRTNLEGTIVCTQCVLKYMIRAGYGKIVNMSSVSGIIGSPGQANYTSSKAGIIGFTKAVALEVSSYGILVNAVAPGFVETAMVAKMDDQHKKSYIGTVPLGRFARPEEISRTVMNLLESDYITGQVISIDGGLTLI